MLSTPLSEALRTTQLHLKRLKELAIERVEDLLMYLPRRYVDSSEITPIIRLIAGEVQTVKGVITSIASRSLFRRRMEIVTILMSDVTASLEAVLFNQSYLLQKFKKGDAVMMSGKVTFDKKKGRLVMKSPVIEADGNHIHAGRIVPVYPETELDTNSKRRLSSKWLREKLFQVLPFVDEFREYLPFSIIRRYKLMGLSEALRNAHFPKTHAHLAAARKRLAFNELFLLQLAALYKRNEYRRVHTNYKKNMDIDWNLIKKFTASLPWPLTRAQKKAIAEICIDLCKPFPMSRLLEGETGAGKTVVASAAIFRTLEGGMQACLLAPTEILARQHYATLKQLLAPHGIEPALLCGATSAQEKKSVYSGLSSGNIRLVIGTHALLQESLTFANLGLAVIDEQHRFGVRQREVLKTHGSPHLLHMTATPIPRTLALVLYGDQDLSILDELPPGRQKIITKIVAEEKRNQAYAWIAKQVEQGRQVFIIFPLIEESPALALKAATQEYARLQEKIFPHLRLGLLHGQLKPAQKEAVMNDFAQGTSHILVSTSVVEVGVDVPNATIMMIEGAERFGLAQLHQFRGRVGRGVHESYCLLFPTSMAPQNLQRLKALVKHSSGFQLAEIDLQIRGPGEVFGTAQSGIPDLRMANLSDQETIKQARQAAEAILEEDGDVTKHPLLKELIKKEEKIAIDY